MDRCGEEMSYIEVGGGAEGEVGGHIERCGEEMSYREVGEERKERWGEEGSY